MAELTSLPGLRLTAATSVEREELYEQLDSDHNNVIMREHQKILHYIHDLKFSAVHQRNLAEMVKSATKFGSSITVLVEDDDGANPRSFTM